MPPDKSPPFGVRGRVRVGLGIGVRFGVWVAFFRGDFFLEPYFYNGLKCTPVLVQFGLLKKNLQSFGR